MTKILNLLKIVLFGILLGQQAMAGLPPTSVQGQSDSSAQTKFNFQVPYNQKTDLGGVKSLFETGNKNLLSNASFENTSYATSWTLTTISGAVETTNIIDGKQSANLTFSTTGNIAQDVTPSIQTNGVNFEATCKVKTSMTTIQVCGRSGGTEAVCNSVPASNTWQIVSTNFVGPANGTSVGVDVKTSSSASGTVYVDDCYVGPARNIAQVSQAQLIGTLSFSQAASCTWTTTSATFADYASNASCNAAAVTGTVTSPGKVLQAQISNAAPGTYFVTAQFTGLIASASSLAVQYRLNENTTSTGLDAQLFRNNSSSASVYTGVHLSGTFANTTTQTLTFAIQGSIQSAGTNSIDNSLLNEAVTFNVYFFPTQQQSAYQPSITPASWSGAHRGTCNASTTATSFTTPSGFSACTPSERTNRNFGTVTMSTTTPAITFIPPRAGYYFVCANSHVFGSTNAYYYSARLTADLTNSIADQFTSNTNNQVLPLCGIVNFSTVTSTTLTVQIKTSNAAGTANYQSAGIGDSTTWSIVELDAPMPAPYITGLTNLVTKAISASTTATIDTQMYLCSASGGAVTLTLPLASQNKNVQFSMKKTDSSSSACIFGVSGSDTIDGASTLSNPIQYNSWSVISDGSVWWIM